MVNKVDIGKEKRKIRSEPIVDPVPKRDQPERDPHPEPRETPEREAEPAKT